MPKLIAALGNPGAKYAETRHNIAWQMVEHLSFFQDLDWQDKFKGQYAPLSIEGEKIYFIKPLTYMNRSGDSVLEISNFFKIELSDILVIHDELELELGTISFKKGGGLAGHNGLRSMAACFGSRDFSRLRLGISRPAHKDITSFVLGKFTPDERITLPSFLEGAAKILEENITKDYEMLAKELKKERILQDVE